MSSNHERAPGPRRPVRPGEAPALVAAYRQARRDTATARAVLHAGGHRPGGYVLSPGVDETGRPCVHVTAAPDPTDPDPEPSRDTPIAASGAGHRDGRWLRALPDWSQDPNAA